MSLKEVKVLSTVPVRRNSASIIPTIHESNNNKLPTKVRLPDQISVQKTPELMQVMEKNGISNGPQSMNYVYVNQAYVGSTNNINHPTNVITQPPTSVVREQYWACSKWPYGQKVLAITVGVLLGAVIGLTVSLMLLEIKDRDIDFFALRNRNN